VFGVRKPEPWIAVRRTGIRRLLSGTGERNSGLDATWWAIGAIVLTVAAVGVW
jgi:hypothetical protein